MLEFALGGSQRGQRIHTQIWVVSCSCVGELGVLVLPLVVFAFVRLRHFLVQSSLLPRERV